MDHWDSRQVLHRDKVKTRYSSHSRHLALHLLGHDFETDFDRVFRIGHDEFRTHRGDIGDKGRVLNRVRSAEDLVKVIALSEQTNYLQNTSHQPSTQVSQRSAAILWRSW